MKELICLLLLSCFLAPTYSATQMPDLDNKETLMQLLQSQSSAIDPEAKALIVYEKGFFDWQAWGSVYYI